MQNTEAKKKLISAVAAAVLLSSDPKEPLIIEDLDSPDFAETPNQEWHQEYECKFTNDSTRS